MVHSTLACSFPCKKEICGLSFGSSNEVLPSGQRKQVKLHHVLVAMMWLLMAGTPPLSSSCCSQICCIELMIAQDIMSIDLGIDLDPRRIHLPIHSRVIHILIGQHSWGTGIPSIVHQLVCDIAHWFQDWNLAFVPHILSVEMVHYVGMKHIFHWLESSRAVNKTFILSLPQDHQVHNCIHERTHHTGALSKSWNVLELH